MKKIFQLTILISLIACQIEEKDAPSPTDSYIKYFGEANTSYEMVDMEVIYEEADPTTINSIIMLGTRDREDALRDIYLMKTDVNGVLIADTAYSYDDNSDDVAKKISRAGANILVVGNTVTSNESRSRIGVVWNEFTLDLTPVSQPHPDTTLFSIFTNPLNLKQISANDLIETSDGNFVMVGNFTKQDDEEQYYRMKINSAQKGNISYPSSRTNNDPALEWFVSGGVLGTEGDDLVRVFEETNGELVFIGNSFFVDNEGNTGLNAILVEATSLGTTSNIFKYGFNLNENGQDATDEMTDAIRRKQGGYAIVGTSTKGNTSQSFFVDSSNPSSRTLLPSSFTLNGVSTKSNALGITQGSKNDFVIVGQYPDFRIDTEEGQQDKGSEAMIYRTDQLGVPIDEFEVNYGLIGGNDRAVVAETLPDGKILIGATIDFGDTFMSLIKLNDTGQLDD